MPTVAVTVGGVNVTADVIFASARFESKVNGQAGEAYMRVRDLDSTYSFTEGADWLVTVDGGAAWRGYVTQVVRTYIYPAGDVAESGLQRFIDLRGADLNLLFSRRIVFKGSAPAEVSGVQYAAGTADTVAITELLSNWLDLSSDDLDTTTGIVGVGDLDPAQPTRAWSGGWQWGQAMASIAMLPAAIFYLRPEAGSPRGTLVYCDVDVPDAPFGLSDQPNGTTLRGYREAEITLDGTSLANDVLCWGMGYGSTTPVVKRARSTTSIAAHSLWQTSRIVPGVYKQVTIDRIANSILNGSPQSKRGAKNDRPSVRLVTYETGLLAGHKLTFASEVWGWTDVIPVRQMAITFESPTAPRYEILLSHEIDSPWGFVDQFWPQIPDLLTFCPDPPCLPCITCGQQDSDCECGGLFDDFDRTYSNGWGTATPGGYAWETGTVYSDLSVASGVATMRTIAGPAGTQAVARIVESGPWSGPFVVTTTVKFLTVPSGDSYFFTTNLTDSISTRITFLPRDDGLEGVSLRLGAGTPVHTTMAFAQDTWYNVEWTWEGFGGDLTAKVWVVGGSKPTTPTVTLAGPASGEPGSYFAIIKDAGLNDTDGWQIGPITIEDYRCVLPNFDDFERSVTGGWGTGTAGQTWSHVFPEAGGTPSVVGGAGLMTINLPASGSIGVDMTTNSGFPTSGSWEMLAKVKFSMIPNNTVTAYSELRFTWYKLGPTVLVDSYLQVCSSAASGYIGTGSGSLSKTDWVANTLYCVRWAYDSDAGTTSLKVWPDAGTEPGSWDVVAAATAGITGITNFEVLGVGGRTLSPPTTQIISVESINIDYSAAPCYYENGVPVGPIPQSAPQGPTGFGCIDATRVSSTVYTTPSAFQPNSTFVWRDGLFQRRGTDYTEGSDHQTLTFSDAVASTSSIRVCYFTEVQP